MIELLEKKSTSDIMIPYHLRKGMHTNGIFKIS